MADLNALIAQGYQFQAPPDPFVNYAKMQQLDQGEQTNQLNRMKMQEYQRGMEETNAMRRLDPNSETYLQDIMRINPKMGFEFGKLQREAKNAETEGQIKTTKLLTDKLAMLPEAYRMADTPEAYLALHRSIHADPVIGPYLKSVGATPEKGLAAIQNAVETGKFDELRMRSMQSVSQILESMKLITGAAGGFVYDPKTKSFMQAPEKTAKTIGTVSPGDFTPASVANFNRSGDYGDLVLKPVDRAAAAPRTQQISLDDGSLGIVNMDTGVITRSTIDGAPASKNTLKPLPVHAQKSITGGATALSKLDETIKSVEAADATGFKGFLPDTLLNRADPKGTTARANVADIGSLVLHDRSGASVTASETPRLLPFIPSIKDDKPTTLKKLKRMRDIQAEELDALQGTYTRDQGYREFKVPEKAVPGVNETPPAGVDAALWNVMTPEERKLWKK
jgi:hypothetical protein